MLSSPGHLFLISTIKPKESSYGLRLPRKACKALYRNKPVSEEIPHNTRNRWKHTPAVENQTWIHLYQLVLFHQIRSLLNHLNGRWPTYIFILYTHPSGIQLQQATFMSGVKQQATSQSCKTDDFLTYTSYLSVMTCSRIKTICPQRSVGSKGDS